MICRELGDRHGEAVTLDDLGETRRAQGRFREAAGYYRQSLRVHRLVGDRPGEARTLRHLGVALGALGSPVRAGVCLRAAARLLGHPEAGDGGGDRSLVRS